MTRGQSALVLCVLGCFGVGHAHASDAGSADPARDERAEKAFVFNVEGVDRTFPVGLNVATGKWLSVEFWAAGRSYPELWPEYQLLCVNHCLVPVARPSYQFGLSLGPDADRIIPVHGNFKLAGGETITAHVHTRPALHVIGGILSGLGIMGAVTGGTLIAAAPTEHGKVASGYFALAGAGIALAVVGLAIALQPATADLTVAR